jgi:hypothetical protein
VKQDRPLFGDPRPRDVPEYARAAIAGRLPPVPPHPPALLPGPTAGRLSNLMLLAAAAVILIPGACLVAVDRMEVDVPVLGLLLFLLVVGAGFYGVFRLARVVGRRNYKELAHGYSTVTPIFAMYEPTSDGRFAKLDWNIPWDFGGCWVLKNDGSVISAPDVRLEPPGFYPSPHDPARYELWTGKAWAGVYR